MQFLKYIDMIYNCWPGEWDKNKMAHFRMIYDQPWGENIENLLPSKSQDLLISVKLLIVKSIHKIVLNVK